MIFQELCMLNFGRVNMISDCLTTSHERVIPSQSFLGYFLLYPRITVVGLTKLGLNIKRMICSNEPTVDSMIMFTDSMKS